MLKAVAPVLIALGTLAIPPAVAADEGFKPTCRRVSVSLPPPHGEPGVLVCPAPGM